MENLAASPERDFASSFGRGFPGMADHALADLYDPYAKLAVSVAAEVEALGVWAVRDARLCHLEKALEGAPVTTLIAHWRSARFRSTDIIEAERVRGYLAARGISRASGLTEMAGALNGILDEQAAPEIESAGLGVMARKTAQQRSWFDARQAIESELPGCFRGGAAVEFADGFHPIAEIVNRAAPGYRGTLDLTVCQSVVLGEEIKRRSPQCRVMMSADRTSLDFRLALYHQAVAQIAAKPEGWPEVNVRIRKGE